VSIVALVLLVAALLVVVGAEWPRLSARVGPDAVAARSRTRRKQKLRVVQGEGEEQDDFEASVERDLANLPVIQEPRDRR
jgi:hypothetical protein